MEFPFIHTNFWDALIAVPAIIVLIEILKILLPLNSSLIPMIASAIGLVISIFITHPHSLWTGIVMGIVYGITAVGAYASFVKFVSSYRNKRPSDFYR
ncbi:hypothetical protein [Fictibacillus phosphorivorans]|uniref:hypothetical protein n=1 Tax=Fictibacillus phosphorivorans TaxID=1221500 RepID=UPI00203C35B6|nr:hypothetical protein [Fictibacillus phosphorivorans]MCM3720231.1 hypothetical protein [Fictibacillus phosphorivorans]MCM3777924.1 hypothetical protein [Fictibacillus phosphorivorans]